MIGGWRGTLVIDTSIEFVQTMGDERAQDMIASMHKDDWRIRGPRGGRWVAPSSQVTVWQWDKGMFFGPVYRLIGHRKEIRYVRPRTRAAEAWDAAELGEVVG